MKSLGMIEATKSTPEKMEAASPEVRSPVRGVEHAGVIDAMIHDPVTDAVTMVMEEPRPWDGSEMRLFQLQEKINAYLSFALDGEMAEAYPMLEGKALVLRLDSATAPDSMTRSFLKMVRDQIAFQDIKFEMRVPESVIAAEEKGGGGGCGTGCGCHPE